MHKLPDMGDECMCRLIKGCSILEIAALWQDGARLHEGFKQQRKEGSAISSLSCMMYTACTELLYGA